MKKCCKKCYSNYTEKSWPAHTVHDACINSACECHSGTTTPGTADCGFDCHIQAPYGFVPEAGCPIHDVDEDLPMKDEGEVE